MSQISIPAFNLIANFFYGLFGNGYLMTTVILAVIIITLVTLRVNIAVSLLILIPLLVGFALNTATNNMVYIDTYIVLVLFMIAGVVFSLFILFWWTR